MGTSIIPVGVDMNDPAALKAAYNNPATQYVTSKATMDRNGVYTATHQLGTFSSPPPNNAAFQSAQGFNVSQTSTNTYSGMNAGPPPFGLVETGTTVDFPKAPIMAPAVIPPNMAPQQGGGYGLTPVGIDDPSAATNRGKARMSSTGGGSNGILGGAVGNATALNPVIQTKSLLGT